jgi:hypothetical protein
MTALSDQCTIIRQWLAIGADVYPDQVVTQWIRMCEEWLSNQLRIRDNLQIDTGVLVGDRYLMPKDWQEMDFVRVIGGKPLRYVPRDDYYNPLYVADQPNCYTITGNYIITSGAHTSPITLEISYYQDVPHLEDELTWVQIEYPTLFTTKTLHVASMYAIEDERNSMWETQANNLVGAMNFAHTLSKASGSRLTRRHLQRRTFG